MASRTSAMYSQEYYQGSRRGRPIMQDMGWEMFPQKHEVTPIIEDAPSSQLNDDRRATLMDYSPEQNSLFAYEEPRRNTYAKSHINLRDGGIFGSTTDPWMNSGQDGKDGFDTQFHDKDPRGWSTEQNWKEYRRIAESIYATTDFKDDGDYSETSGGIHPNTLYKNIRSAQNWVKARLKIFDEAWEGRQNGGVGIYPNVSKVYRSDMEDSSVQVDGTAPSRTYDDPEIAQHHNVNISNVVHLGSKFLRVNNTTDHLVKVAAYGKLYKQRGLINHESQLRILEDDTPWSSLEGYKQTPRNLVKMMASQIYSDNPNISPYTASEIGRILMQNDQVEQGANQGLSRDESENYNRNRALTKDIMALLGVTANEVKFLESYEGENKKIAEHTLANIYKMATVVHSIPANEKLQMRNELILRSAGMGLAPATASDLRKIQDSVVVNPKIVEFMSWQTGRTPMEGSPASNRIFASGDPENKLNNFMEKASLFVYKTPGAATEDVTSVMWKSNRGDTTKDTTKKTASYKHLAKYAQRIDRNQAMGITTQLPGESEKSIQYNTMPIGETDFQENLRSTALDNEFGQNRYLNRHTGKIGTKNMRRHIDSDYLSLDHMNELGSSDVEGMSARKNAKNRNNQSR